MTGRLILIRLRIAKDCGKGPKEEYSRMEVAYFCVGGPHSRSGPKAALPQKRESDERQSKNVVERRAPGAGAGAGAWRGRLARARCGRGAGAWHREDLNRETDQKLSTTIYLTELKAASKDRSSV